MTNVSNDQNIDSADDHAIPEAVVGGGWIVLQRNSVGRVRAPRCPYEHGSRSDAEAEAARRSSLSPGRQYIVFGVTSHNPSMRGA